MDNCRGFGVRSIGAICFGVNILKIGNHCKCENQQWHVSKGATSRNLESILAMSPHHFRKGEEMARNNVAVQEEPEENGNHIVLEAIQAAVEEAKSDLATAASILEGKTRQNRALYDEIMEPHIGPACWRLIQQYARAERQVIWQSSNTDKGMNGQRVKYLAATNAQSLLEMTLPIRGLPRLGDCSKDQIQQAMAYYRDHANDMSHKAKFLELVHALIKPDSIVRKQLKLTQLQKCYDTAHVN